MMKEEGIAKVKSSLNFHSQQGDRLEFLCRCSFLEIYNEQIFDLLDPASTGLPLREDIKRGVFVDGLLERDVTSARDAYRVQLVRFLLFLIFGYLKSGAMEQGSKNGLTPASSHTPPST